MKHQVLKLKTKKEINFYNLKVKQNIAKFKF